MFGPGIGAPEILIVVGVIVLLFGGRKLPELARGSGRALRIFKSEVKGLKDDDEDTKPEALETSEAEKKPEQG
jgi:sec-independent protein translocase protein TatA